MASDAGTRLTPRAQAWQIILCREDADEVEAELTAAHTRASFAEADNEHLRVELRQLRVELTMERLRSKAWKKRAKKAERKAR